MNYLNRIMRAYYLLALAATLSHLEGADDRQILAVRDGIKLYSERIDSQNEEEILIQIRFSVENENNYPLLYLDNGRGNRFSFTLLDASGNKLDQIHRWHLWNDPYASDVGKRATAQLEPGSRLEFVLRPKDAYGDNWALGRKLLVKWEPEHANEGLVPKGWTLKAEIDPVTLSAMPKEESGHRHRTSNGLSEPDRLPDSIAPSSRPETSSKSPTSSGSPSNGPHIMPVLWVFIALLIIVLVLKKLLVRK